MKKRNIMACWVLLASFLAGGSGIQAQELNDSLVNVAFKTVKKDDLLGGVSTVNIAELLEKGYGTYSLDNLQSFIGGFSGAVWGQDPLILVDGIPRRATDVRLVEVESITVMKGGSAVILYGSSAAKGVILVNTKRGSDKPLSIDVRANTGLLVPKAYPNYLDAADYMRYYNEALTNDGISTSGAGYSQEQIDNTVAGLNPFRYPDIDFYSSEYLRKASSRSDITTEVSGGNENTRYYTNLGLAYNNGLVKYGEQKKNNDFSFNVRGNVDMKLTKWLTASTDAAVVIENSYAGRGGFWNAASTVAPNFNRFSPLIPIDMLDPNNSDLQTIVNNSNHVIDGKYLLGGQSTNTTNVFSDMLAAGYIKTRNRTFLYNLSAGADLSSVLKGLTFKATTSMDYTSIYSEAYQLPYATYRPTWTSVDGKDVITALEPFGADKNSTNEFVGRSTYTQTMSFRSQFNYDRSFAERHHVSASLLGWGYNTRFSSDVDNEGGSDYHPIRNANLGFQANYNFLQKYYADFSSALVHSAKLPPGKRSGLSTAFTLGWRISNEDFFKENLSFINNLKLTTSYSAIKQDLDVTGFRPNGTEPTDYYLYQGYYSNTGALSGWYQWRDGTAGGNTTLSGRGANPDLTFIDRKEYRIGLDGGLFDNLITLDANYFRQNTEGLLGRGVTLFPSYFAGSGDFRPWINFNKERRSGLDFALNLNKKTSEVQYSLGVVGMFYSSKVLQREEVQAESYLNRTGRPLDASFGYISEGFFQDADEIANHATQTFGIVKPGDLKYKDVNGDGIIDNRDQVDLGQAGWSASPFTFGINVTVKWRNLTFFALGSGNTGAIGYKNSSYYWVGGAAKYSDVVLDRWTEATKNTATYPRLTTNSNNNFRNSTFWMYKTDRFNLNRVQITYDFDEAVLRNTFIRRLGVYVQGDNLLVVSKERKLMETNIGTAPQNRFFNLGVRTSF